MLHSRAGYRSARPIISVRLHPACNARPVHTVGLDVCDGRQAFPVVPPDSDRCADVAAGSSRAKTPHPLARR